ncbi:hypothetical protein [Streptomyces sp. NPDC002825]|uniref:hypothetical protein n=1 Tax=Streptomyces sp. NPDC002825 TaxID=3154666 RepID=UPI0033311907
MLWIGGAQWAGKTTVSEILALRYGLTAYQYAYHDAPRLAVRVIEVDGVRDAAAVASLVAEQFAPWLGAPPWPGEPG